MTCSSCEYLKEDNNFDFLVHFEKFLDIQSGVMGYGLSKQFEEDFELGILKK